MKFQLSVLVLLISVTSAAQAADEPANAPAEPEGMRQLFNGKDLSGWDGDPRLWSVRDGVIHG
jgi:hypothetical protein